MSTLIHEELSKSIIGCAMTVLNELKPGLDDRLLNDHEPSFGPSFEFQIQEIRLETCC